MTKTPFLVLFVFVAASAFGQWAGSFSSQVTPYHAPEHPAHASMHALAQESYVLSGAGSTSAHGEKPLWEFQLTPQSQASLGDVARLLKEEHTKVKKARIKYEN